MSSWSLPPTTDSARVVVAFTGLAGSGKSTAAAHLAAAHGYTRTRFAGPLKAMMAALGLSHEELEGSLKEQPCELLCGRTPRHGMQSLGTEWGRALIGEDVWVRAWRAALPATGLVVVEDCRFPNEAEVVRAVGGVLIHVDRPGAGKGAAGHSSEAFIAELRPHGVIRNATTMDEFLAEVDALHHVLVRRGAE